jgi:hypothetical protein
MRVLSNKVKALGRRQHLNKWKKFVNHSSDVHGEPFGERAANCELLVQQSTMKCRSG